MVDVNVKIRLLPAFLTGMAVEKYVVAFIVTNATRVEVSFVAFDTRAPLIVLMVVCVLLGVVIGIVAARIVERRHDEGVQSSGTPNGPADAS